MIALYWLLAAAIFIVLEILTMGLTTIWFAGGALTAALCALLAFPVGVQFLVFFVVSLILLCITRPLANRFVNNKVVKTNVDSLIGQKCLVTRKIDNLRAEGEVTLKGQTWSARSSDGKTDIPENAIVKVEAISGVKLLVSVVSIPETIHLQN